MEIKLVKQRPSTMTFRELSKTTRVYFFPKDENFLDNLVNRKHRPHQIWRKMLPGVLAQLGISGAKAKWSQKAGCRCPCSPGFILDVSVNDGDHNRVDIYVTV